MFKCILVALEGSAASNAGLKSAIQLASDQHASLVGMHAIDDAGVAVNLEGGYLPASYVDTLYASLRKQGQAILDKAQAAARAAGVEIRPVLADCRGRTIAQGILQQASKAKADVIVIGTHGRRGLSRILMGSDAEAVVREARVPVLLVRGGERAKRKRTTSSRKRAASATAVKAATRATGKTRPAAVA